MGMAPQYQGIAPQYQGMPPWETFRFVAEQAGKAARVELAEGYQGFF